MRNPDDKRETMLQRIYGNRFEGVNGYRNRIWEILTSFFGTWIAPTGSVLDLGAGYCEFINNVKAQSKFAMDLNPEVYSRAGRDVTVLQQDCCEPWALSDGSLDVVFSSNFLEHLPSKDMVLTVLSSAYQCLKLGGRFIAMGPNIRYVPGAYWDFFDHYVQLTELSLSEALRTCGFEIEHSMAKFLPYTMSDGRRYPLWMLRCYLAFPIAWKMLGKQFLVVARKPANTESEGLQGANLHSDVVGDGRMLEYPLSQACSENVVNSNEDSRKGIKPA